MNDLMNTIAMATNVSAETDLNDIRASKISNKVAGVMTALYCAAVTMIPAYASADVGGITAGIASGTQAVWDILKAIVLPIAAIMLAVCGVKLIWGGQRAAEEAKSLIVKIVIGVGLVMIAPSAVSVMKGWFNSGSTSMADLTNIGGTE